MKRSELIEQLPIKYNISPALANLLVKSMLEQITNALLNHKRIEIRGFGSFDTKYRPSRISHNPKTGEKVNTSSKYVVHFKAGKQLREQVATKIGK